ncbi:hypothetical protein [Leifsonia poae]|uniref:hypothetical protein n=1 Tax=Leifsonia poae TaxID=110933 RepID=UPI003D668BCE
MGIYLGGKVMERFPDSSSATIGRIAFWLGYAVIAVVIVGVFLPMVFAATF